MKKNNYKYILWDFDGTVMDSYPGVIDSLKYALGFYGIHEEREDVLHAFIGPPFRQSLPAVYGFDKETTEDIIHIYREYYHAGAMFNCSLYAGIPEAAAAFRSKGYKQYIASSKPQVACEAILKNKEAYDMFDGVFGASLDGKTDTKVQVLEEAFRVIGETDRSAYVLIGDTKYDAAGAKQAGIDCIGITYGNGSRRELEENGAAAVFDTIGDAAGWIIQNRADLQ